ncbi:MAG: DUF116 domain-containing protein, partial [Chloroflexi bacterium]|nr:DUF116 domain-containing protein [Chloroflexota bacterium]
MAEVITYSLRGDEQTSDGYYRAIAALAQEWMPGAAFTARESIALFRAHRLAACYQDRSDAEYAFELLVLGVLLREHGGEAMRLPRWKAWLLIQLIKAPGRWPISEQTAKKLRGWLGWQRKPTANREGRNVARLMMWLRATGQESRADRLSQWQGYLASAGPVDREATLTTALALAQDFSAASQHTLGKYTRNVDTFLAQSAGGYSRRYDAELVSRTPVEYHLGMLGTEILSRAYRERFVATRRRIVILPPCMRAKPDGACQATPSPLGAVCQSCTPQCHVNMVTQLGKKHGYEVYMIPDQLRRIGAEAGRSVRGLGLIGVSCALTNWSGGWDASTLGVPAQ